MKIAYLIIAHDEFAVLDKLISCLDDARNDVFVHFDKKAKRIPSLKVERARLFVLENRIDVRWGNVSQIACEYALFSEASKRGKYDRYILLSGVHLPLKSQDYIHEWFEKYDSKEVMAPVPNCDFQTQQKMHRFNLFTKWFKISIIAQYLWHVGMMVQRFFGIYRNRNLSYSISSNWVCLTDKALGCLLECRKEVLEEFKYSFCGDEFFVRTVLERNGFADDIVISDELLLTEFSGGSVPRTFGLEELDSLKSRDCLFARKFSAMR